MKARSSIFFFIIAALFHCTMVQAAKSTQTQQVISPQYYYGLLQEALDKKLWNKVLFYADKLQKQYAKTSFGKEALYFQGVAYFEKKEYETANEKFTLYLQDNMQPKYFDEIIQYKYAIAQKFFQGEKRHLFGLTKLPKWMSAKEKALQIYEEIINTLPSEEVAMKSLYAKGEILDSFQEYRESIETFQQLIRRFPKSEYAIEGFMAIGKIYLKQCNPKRQDLNLIGLAEVNLKRFLETFPNEKRCDELEKMVAEMKEIYAQGLFEIGKFYERTNKPKASVIYYSKIMDNFPTTRCAKLSEKRLQSLKK